MTIRCLLYVTDQFQLLWQVHHFEAHLFELEGQPETVGLAHVDEEKTSDIFIA